MATSRFNRMKDKASTTTNDFIIGEYLFLTASIESSGAVSDGVAKIRRHILGDRREGDSVLGLIRDTSANALAPFSSNLEVYLEATDSTNAEAADRKAA